MAIFREEKARAYFPDENWGACRIIINQAVDSNTVDSQIISFVEHGPAWQPYAISVLTGMKIPYHPND